MSDIVAESECVTVAPANEWEATGNYLLYTEMNSRLAERWREEFATNPTTRAVIHRIIQ